MAQVPKASGQPAPDDQTPEDRAPVLPEPPAAAVELAAQRELGQLHDGRVVTSAGTIGRVALIVGVPAVVLAAIGFQGGSAVLGVLGLLGLFGVLIALVIAAYAVKTAVAGADDWYLYTNGLVAQRRRQLRAVAWPDVATVTRKRMGRMVNRRGMIMNPQTVRGYELGLRDGSTVFVHAVDAFPEGQRLGGQLEQLASQAGVPVTG